MDNLVRSERGTEEEEALVRRAGEEVHRFVKSRWAEGVWETAWFVNPPVGVKLYLSALLMLLNHAALVFVGCHVMQRLQSVLGLAHIHVFARQKTKHGPISP